MTEREKALEAALRDIARQRKTDEMPREDRHNGDFEGACDTMIDVARAALAMPATVDGADFLRGWEAGRDAAADALQAWANELWPDGNRTELADAIRAITPPEDKP
jgi:hypothetical protein